MLQRRYPHRGAGRLASLLFLVVGFAGGWLAGTQVRHGPGPLAGGIVWALIAAGVAYLVFSSEGPARRPQSRWQAGMADGLITGVMAGLVGAAIDLVVASGTSGAGNTSVAGALGASVGLGTVAGAAAGLLLGLHPALERAPVATGKRRREERRAATLARGSQRANTKGKAKRR
jgi:hypothetical protein